jgi:Pyridoxamine 5'-phosphate oxidase
MIDLAAHARSLVDANLYVTVGTVDGDGRPWTAPVYFAPLGDREWVWVSESDAEHSRHLAGRPAVSLLVFDSTVRPYHGRAVYAVGEARELTGAAEIDRALGAYPRPGTGAAAVDLDDVTGDSPYRFYAATLTGRWVLCPREPRTPCELHGLQKDHRARVE